MKRDTVNYFAVGAVVLGALALLIVILFRITGTSGASDDYPVYYSQVAGLKYGTPVYFEGYRVGQVGAVEPVHEGTRTRFKVTLQIQEGWPIPNDSIAQVASSGLLSDMFIYIDQGEADEIYSPGDEIPGEESADIFAALGDLAGEIQALADGEIAPLIRMLSERVDVITNDIQSGTPEVLDKVRAIATNLETSSASLNQLLGSENRDLVSSTLANLDEASASTAALTEELRATREELDQALQQVEQIVVENRPEVRRMVQQLELTVQELAVRLDDISFNLDEASRNFNEFTRAIRNKPNRLLFTPADDEVETEQ